MAADKTRKHDLIELYEQRKHAPNAYMRDTIDKALDRIMRENGAVRAVREKLIMAVRNDDRRAVMRFQEELWHMDTGRNHG